MNKVWLSVIVIGLFSLGIGTVSAHGQGSHIIQKVYQPIDGQVIGDSVQIDVKIHDSSQATSVTFESSIDGIDSTFTGCNGPAPVDCRGGSSINTSNIGPGNHLIKINATDNLGNTDIKTINVTK